MFALMPDWLDPEKLISRGGYLLIFGIIFASYMFQLLLVRLFEEREYAYGETRPRYLLPDWLVQRRHAVDARHDRQSQTPDPRDRGTMNASDVSGGLVRRWPGQ